MKVYYNKSCSICRAEINHYKKQNIKEIEWVDITNNMLAEIDTLKNDKTLLRRLHVIKDGKVYGGAKAFLLLWKKMPKYKFLYYFFKLPIIFNIFSISYESIAYFLYLKNKNQLKKNPSLK
jgi:predicted DCC family thiol-disulfide oxidoreductase YuxK